ncbi:probable YAH1 - Ferredoxin of the mitochondrial matrix [Ustilago bromivora]|uniref:Probable YAH1 - Ferredoxin of the mitochondrial matrix n=1 Tax=Ustilago bromivora TaxID=307758 RepID=A0A8H8QGM4_9BASI|nr:probable YAH1 - Ferredoxin of the mitochondrial matrix [Ustilago bromivora]
MVTPSATRTALSAATHVLRRQTLTTAPKVLTPRTIPIASSSRLFTTTPIRPHGGITRPAPGTGVKIHFVDPKGEPLKSVEASEGDDLLSVAHEYDIDLEGACEGSIACSTCHVILEPDVYDSLEEPCDDENDMLDLAFGLTDTSRLGCQVKVTKEQDGMKVQLPAATRNMYVDGE